MKNRATAIGFTAILFWSLLAVLTVGTAPVPPFLLNALCFGIGGGIGLLWLRISGDLGVLRLVHWRIYAFGTAALFGYHALYFSALRIAPAAEASLIAYLWPLFIVLFSGFLPGERLRVLHVAGAAIAFVGAAFLVLRGGTGVQVASLPGLGLAFLCAITWAVYSVASRAFGAVPTAAVVVYCVATAVLSAAVHLAVEDTIWPVGGWGWASVVGLGLGPVGAAFFTWDIGMKQGDIQLLGVASYAAPLLSTVALILADLAEVTPSLLIAAAMITGGAGIAARASLAKA